MSASAPISVKLVKLAQHSASVAAPCTRCHSSAPERSVPCAHSAHFSNMDGSHRGEQGEYDGAPHRSPSRHNATSILVSIIVATPSPHFGMSRGRRVLTGSRRVGFPHL